MPNKARLYSVMLIDSEFKFGAIAQLGERNTGSVEVSGSIPLSSTKFSLKIASNINTRLVAI